MNGIKPYPTYLESIDDILNVTMSDGQVVTKGPVNGYPGLQMSYLGVDPEGTAYWEDALEVRTDIATISTKIEINYAGVESGIYNGLQDLSSFYVELLEINDYIEIDKSLLRTFPETPNVVSVGYDKDNFTIDSDIKVTATNSHPSYPAKYALSEASGQRMLFMDHAAGQYIQIEYPEPLLLIAFDYIRNSNSPSYHIRKASVQTSLDGENWTTVYVIEDGSENLPYQRVAPTVGKYVRIITDTPGQVGMDRFVPFTSRTESLLGYDINKTWFDETAIRLIEHTNYFEIVPIFKDALDTTDAIYVSNDQSTTIISSGRDSVFTQLPSSTWHLYKFDLAINNNLGISTTSRSFLLEPGYYVIDYNYLLKTDVGQQTIIGYLGLLDITTMSPLDGPLHIRTDGSNMDAYPIEGRFECYVEKPTYAGIGFFNRSLTYAYSDSKDYNCKLTIQRLPGSPAKKYMCASPLLNSTSILSKREGTVIEYIDLEAVNTTAIDAFGTYGVGVPQTWYQSKYTLLPGDPHDIDITLTAPMSPDFFNLGHVSSSDYVNNFEIIAYVGEQWLTVGTHVTSTYPGDMVIVPLKKVSTTKWKIRLHAISRASQPIRLEYCDFHTLGQDIRGHKLAYEVVGAHSSVLSPAKWQSKDYRSTAISTDGNSYVDIRIDTLCNLLAVAKLHTSVNNLTGNVKLYRLDAGEYVTDIDITEGDITFTVAKNLSPGIYRLSGLSYIADIYPEEIV